MKPRFAIFTTGIFLLSYFAFAKFIHTGSEGKVEAAAQEVTQGALNIIGKGGGKGGGQGGEAGGECPLKHTDVNAEISGQLARVTLTQEFYNPLPEKIEAVYVFPLPQNAAVDAMTMTIGDRTVKGKIERREEAPASRHN